MREWPDSEIAEQWEVEGMVRGGEPGRHRTVGSGRRALHSHCGSRASTANFGFMLPPVAIKPENIHAGAAVFKAGQGGRAREWPDSEMAQKWEGAGITRAED